MANQMGLSYEDVSPFGSREVGLGHRDVFLSPFGEVRGAFRRMLQVTLSSDDVMTVDAIQHARPLGVPEWLEPAERRLEHLATLPPDWDGYGGVPVADATKVVAFRVLRSVISERDVLPSIVAGSDGAVNLEWSRPGLAFEIEVEPDGSVGAYFRDETNDLEWETDYSSVEARVGDLISRFIEPSV